MRPWQSTDRVAGAGSPGSGEEGRLLYNGGPSVPIPRPSRFPLPLSPCPQAGHLARPLPACPPAARSLLPRHCHCRHCRHCRRRRRRRLEAARPPESRGRRTGGRARAKAAGTVLPSWSWDPALSAAATRAKLKSWARLARAGRGACNFAPGHGRGGGARLQTPCCARSLSSPGFFFF